MKAVEPVPCLRGQSKGKKLLIIQNLRGGAGNLSGLAFGNAFKCQNKLSSAISVNE
jgi:hypothetical protein